MHMMLVRLLLVVAAGCGTAPRPAAPPPRPAPAAGPAAPAPPAVPEAEIAARVAGKVITLAEVDRAIDPAFKAGLQNMVTEEERAYRLAEERLRLLNEMIDKRVLLGVAAHYRFQITEAEIDQVLLDARTQNSLTEAELEKVLADSGFTLAAYREDVREQLLILRVVADEGMKPGEPLTARRERVLARHRPGAKVKIALALPAKPANLPNPLDVSTVLSADDLAATLERKLPAFTTERLDPERTASYDTLHFKATGKPETFDLAIRVWRGSPALIDPKWDDLKASIPGVVKGSKLGTESFAAHEGKIFGHAFIDRPAAIVVLVTCGTGLCRSAAETLAITRLVYDRLDRLTQ
jgi:hypothetical protein